MKLLLTTTSFQDTPGSHHELLSRQGYNITICSGPLTETELLPIIAQYDALLCGDDEITAAVLQKGKEGSLQYISKYGVGLDKIDVIKAKELGIPVAFCPGVNQVSVAEHVFALLLSFAKNIHLEYNITKVGGWKKYIGHELSGKKIGIMGFGAIGKEVAKRAYAFGMKVIITTSHPDVDYINGNGYFLAKNFTELAAQVDIITLHVPLNAQTEEIINDALIMNVVKKGVIIINTARGRLVNTTAIKRGLDNNIIAGYLTDVLDIEPMPENYLLKDIANVLITPHIGSRTYESVERQGVRSVENLINMVSGNFEAYREYLA